MNNPLVALSIAAIALFSFVVFPGHTYLTQDTQIYLAILENLWDPTALKSDLLVGHSHVAYTLYDEYAIALRWLSHSSFQAVLQTTQIACRALAVLGFYLLALRILESRWRALAVAAICAAGAEVWGPAVLVVEFEPSPRAFAIPLLFLAMGLAAHGKVRWAAGVAVIGLVFHPTSAAPFWLCLALLRQWRIGFVSLICGLALILAAAHFQPDLGETHLLFSRVTPELEAIQRLRGAYNWIGMWWSAEWLKYLACVAVGTAAYLRCRFHAATRLTRMAPFLIALPVAGLLSVPVSYLLLDRFKWSAIPLIQPARLLLFTVAISIFLAATAAFRTRRKWEAPFWLALAITPAMAAPPPRIVPTPALAELIRWASSNTPKDAVFLFPEAGKSLAPGYFRSRALRSVYVDWKGGGQANFLPDLGLEWWRRYSQVMQRPQSMARYRELGINYIVRSGTRYQVQKVP